VDVAHNFSEHMLHEHRTGDGSYMPCSGTLLPYAMPKLLHNAASFDLLPPGVELDKATLRADVAYCVRVDEREVGNNPSRIVEGTWLGAELQTWGGPVQQTTRYQVRVFKAGVDPNTPSDGTQPTMPDKEQLRLEALQAAKQCWLQALRAAGLASRARQDAAEAARLKAECDAVAQASRQALLSDLRSAGGAVYMQQLQRAADEAQRRVVEHAARAAAVQATARAAASQAARAELASMRSAAQSEATVLNEAEIAYFARNVQFWAARIARTHDDTRALLSLKRRLRHGALDCACSHVTLHDGATDVRDEDVRQALARVRARLLSERARLGWLETLLLWLTELDCRGWLGLAAKRHNMEQKSNSLLTPLASRDRQRFAGIRSPMPQI